MNYGLPFYSVSLEKPAADVYHTHPQCRVAQKVDPDSRVAGTGEGRKECPFCYVLGQFRSNKFVDMPDAPDSASALPEPAGFATSARDGQALAQEGRRLPR